MLICWWRQWQRRNPGTHAPAVAMIAMHQEHTNSSGEAKADAEKGPGAQSISNSTPLLWLTVLSLDAPAVAVLWQLLFARSFHARLGASVTILLALVVWLIYVADRVLDALKAPAEYLADFAAVPGFEFLPQQVHGLFEVADFTG